MAPARAAAAAGSASWIAAEKENAFQLLQNEKEEVVFPAQHQLEWLNEHMAEIFSNSQLDVAHVFKTPGKMRGKTPRTVRNRPPREARIPLSDVFSSSKPVPRPSPQRQPMEHKLRFEIAADPIEQATGAPSQKDSGYAGSSQGVIDDEHDEPVPSASPNTDAGSADLPKEDTTQPFMDNSVANNLHDELRTTEGSFHSAREDQTVKLTHGSADQDEANLTSLSTEQPPAVTKGSPVVPQEESHTDLDEIGSPSDESTPDRPLVRKSSLTFAALPAREPLKASLGARVSRTSQLEQYRQPVAHPLGPRPAPILAPTDETPAGHETQDVEMSGCRDDDDDDPDENIEILGRDDSDDENHTAKLHSKSSTQRLHEKIDMLGKAPPPRPSKSIPSATALAGVRHADTAPVSSHSDNGAAPVHDDDDDWIKPLTSPRADQTSPAKSYTTSNGNESDDEEFDVRAPELIAHEERMRTPPVRMSPAPGKMMPGYGHTKSASTATLASPAKVAMARAPSPAKSVSMSHPAQPTTTPQGSPRRYLDLSASKSRLQSIMKTAKGLFTSSASVSAAAKLETLSPPAPTGATNSMPGMFPTIHSQLEQQDQPIATDKPARRTRSSTERERAEKRKEKEASAAQKLDEQLEKVRDKERRKAAQQKAAHEPDTKSIKAAPHPSASPRHATEEWALQDPAEVSAMAAKPVRPTRPTREPPVNKAKPAPVSIRVGTMSHRMPMNSTNAGPGAPDVLPAEPKRPGLNKKASTASLQSTTSTVMKSSMHGQPPKPRALLAAERKKELDEREAQRKLEQKREIERKRAAQQEETRKQEQKQRAEAERRERERLAAEQARRQAQQQAIERKRQEAARKAEQQRLDRAANEAAQTRPSSRVGGTQPMGRSLINHPLPTNPAKPAKRPLDEDASSARPPNARYGMAEAKRRKTDEENAAEPLSRPVMSGAPIRQSQLGKKASVFNHPAAHAASQSSHMGAFPAPPAPTRAAPPQMQQFATGAKIPFGDAPNPPSHAKTPVTMMQQKSIHTAKSSPQYPNGEAIHLPEIPTDSEDEDSDDDANGFPLPDWATPGHLTEQLMRQEGMDGDSVFGPMAPLKMEEIFAKGNKDRLKRLRDRTSSANWALSGDGLTLEEVKADREQRERMRVEGGWRFGHH